ncbi:MAG: dTDP-N-acetylfucosamine:lipid II N-acetylfucosaminyltransferase [Sulfurimonas sp.]|jgi:dTDP-N-acetylfucosamine:lipid II N-acetylfucosaminyltransferase|uniref:TDP-N-acetylfucosamine:lipid II N-acetylfucosaminyltransferase n=1 Tax=Sulfurimonas sp. TaxID=2022749 RepID=UPI0039E38FC4
MSLYKYVHLMHNEKFIGPFITFIKEHFDFEEHVFIIIGGVSENIAKIPQKLNVLYFDDSYNSKLNYLKYSKLLKQYTQNADKIILHGLFGDNKSLFLFFNQILLSKCYWVMWGGDLYVYNKSRTKKIEQMRHYIRKKVYSKMGHFITYIKDDYELAQKWYGAKGEHHECFMYPSNLYKEYDIQEKEHDTVNIQLGNSADPTNNHIQALEKLKTYKDENIRIFTPLSYGNQKYAKSVILKGKKIFGDKFIALTDFMSFEKYLKFLSDIDIAIFAHKRQQGMGNIITLLGLGKKVYIRNDITPWELFKDIDVKIFDVENIELDLINETIKADNKNKIQEYFSEKNYLQQLNNLFEG